jgi:hypothetical protein
MLFEIKNILILIAFILHGSLCIGQNNVSDIHSRFGLNIFSDSIVISSWDSLQYEIPHTDSVAAYVNLLNKEINKYPLDFFRKIGIDKLILCADLRIGQQKRAAVPDSEKGQLFLSIYDTKKPYKLSYKTHVFHHELNHCTEFAVWNDYYKKWKRWGRINRKSFSYGSGGIEAYKNPKFNWRGTVNRTEGFLNRYSMLSQEEDRCEIVAFIMNDVESDTIKNSIIKPAS